VEAEDEGEAAGRSKAGPERKEADEGQHLQLCKVSSLAFHATGFSSLNGHSVGALLATFFARYGDRRAL
jgi:hypothetical protein